MTDRRDDDLLLIPPFVRCMYDAPVDVRFPLASDGMHYPTFDLTTQQVVYRFDPVETVAADWVGRGLSPETWEHIRQAEASWRRSDAAKRAWVTIRRRRAEAAKCLSNGLEIPPLPTYRPAPNDGSTEPLQRPNGAFLTASSAHTDGKLRTKRSEAAKRAWVTIRANRCGSRQCQLSPRNGRAPTGRIREKEDENSQTERGRKP